MSSPPENSISLLETTSENENGVPEALEAFSKDVEALPATPPTTSGLGRRFLLWTAINMASTIGIVFTNKAIFSDPDFKLMQTSFASFHFLCTGLTLYVVSRPGIGAFVPKLAGLVEMLPLAFAMCLNVVLPNLSLAFSSVTVYQLCRVLLTPITAIINYVFFKNTIPTKAALVLIPVCLGVGMTSYYDTQPTSDKAVTATSTVGLCFALAGVLASAAYTVLISVYHSKLSMSSSQLLFNQAPISAFLLLFAVPFMDHIPVLSAVPISRWLSILLSGCFAALINISQFFIVNSSGPVTSTVVGHLKTISIVGIGWIVSGRAVTDRSAFGVLITVAGIMGYSYIMLQHRRK